MVSTLSFVPFSSNGIKRLLKLVHLKHKLYIAEQTKTKNMRLQYGVKYTTENGTITAPLKLNDKLAIRYPYRDEMSGRCYTEDGECNSGNKIDRLEALAYGEEAPEPKLELERAFDQSLPEDAGMVTISREDYDRFVAMEKSFREIYMGAKAIG